MVEITRCPTSAAVRAARAVSASTSSPTKMTSASWRRPLRSADAYPSVSEPTSRWVTMASASAWSTSIGSSMVRM